MNAEFNDRLPVESNDRTQRRELGIERRASSVGNWVSGVGRWELGVGNR